MVSFRCSQNNKTKPVLHLPTFLNIQKIKKKHGAKTERLFNTCAIRVYRVKITKRTRNLCSNFASQIQLYTYKTHHHHTFSWTHIQLTKDFVYDRRLKRPRQSCSQNENTTLNSQWEIFGICIHFSGT